MIAGSALGCSSYAGLSEKTRPHMVQRDYAGALAELEGEDGGKDRLLVLLERGLLLHYNGDFDSSNVVFQEAEDLIEELYTKSLSGEALALLTNDNARPYDGAEYERVMVHVYRALNYVGLGEQDGALVEARKASANLAYYTQELENPAYGDDPFVQFFTGLLYEWGGEWNDAFVSYRKALEAYRAAAERGGPRIPATLVESALGAAVALRFADEVEALTAAFPDARTPAVEPGEGEILVLVEAGFVPELVEARADVPILKSDGVDGENVHHVAGRAYHRIGHRHEYHKTKLAYILSIAFPVMPETPPSVGAVALRPAGSGDLASSDVSELPPDAGPRPLERVADIAFNAHENFEDRLPVIMVRTIARGLLKYISKKQAEDAGGSVLGLAVDILGSVTERADVRSWRSLPRELYLLRASYPAGEHDLEIVARGPRGSVHERVTLRGVTVVPGEKTWVTTRVY